MQDEITYIKSQLSKCVSMVARLSSSAHVEVSAPSAPLTLPELNSNSGHSDTANFPNPNSNEDTNSDKYRRMECKNCLDENVVSEIEKRLSAKSKHKELLDKNVVSEIEKNLSAKSKHTRKRKYWGDEDCRRLIQLSKDEKHKNCRNRYSLMVENNEFPERESQDLVNKIRNLKNDKSCKIYFD